MWLMRLVGRVGPSTIGMQLRSNRTVRVDTVASIVSSVRARAVEASSASAIVPSPAKKPRTTKAPTTVAIASTPETGDQILYSYANLVPARLLRRYKRFLADVVLAKAGDEDNTTIDESQMITIYCPNTGPMVGLLDEPNTRVQLSKSDDPKRKYAYTLEMVRVHNGDRYAWVGTHSASANYMVEKAIVSGWFTPQLGIFDTLQREVVFAKNSRVDFVLSRQDADGDVIHQKYVEVKSVTLAWPVGEAAGRCAVFPDTVSDRASKHVTELMELIEHRKKANEKKTKDDPTSLKKPVELSGAIVFLVQRDDCDSFMPSMIHDTKFAQLCAKAEAVGIQLLPYLCRLEPDEHKQSGHVRLLHALPLHKDRAKALDDVETPIATTKTTAKKAKK